MSSKAILFSCLLALVATAGAADTITSTYTPGTETWEYTVAFEDVDANAFRVYLDPNMTIDYLDNIIDGSDDWASPGTLGTYDWSGINLKYLEWTKTNPFWAGGTVVFSYEDALYKPDGIHVMDLANHPGPLLYNPPSYADAPAAETFGGTGAVAESGHWVAITPEPATTILFGLGLLGVSGLVRRRRSA